MISLLVSDFQRSVWSVPSISVAVLGLVERSAERCTIVRCWDEKKTDVLDFRHSRCVNFESNFLTEVV